MIFVFVYLVIAIYKFIENAIVDIKFGNNSLRHAINELFFAIVWPIELFLFIITKVEIKKIELEDKE